MHVKSVQIGFALSTILAMIIVMYFMLIFTTVDQKFARAMAAYEIGDYNLASESFGTLAEQGSAEAQFMLGSLHYNGKGGHVDVEDNCQKNLGRIIPADEQSREIKEFNLEFMNSPDLHGYCASDLPDYTEAVRWYRLAAEQGHADAQVRLGDMYRTGRGVTLDNAEAVRWYGLAAEKGDAIAQAHLAVEHIDQNSHNLSGCMHNFGKELSSKDNENLRLLPKAAMQGNASAQYHIGACLAFGQGGRRDDAGAVFWFRLAAKQGHARAQRSLGNHYNAGLGVPQDYGEAVRWWRLAAQQGNAGDQMQLGHMYAAGEKVPQDYTEAAHWYRMAASQGVAYAQFLLGGMYADGRGVPQDDAAAAQWWWQAAEQNWSSAQYNLGVVHYHGQGVSQDFVEAARWWRLAAEQGVADAQNNLGIMYFHGQGVAQNFVEAHKWYNLAASQYPASESEQRDRAARNRDNIALDMTPTQVAEAQRLASEWQADRPTTREWTADFLTRE